MLSWILIFINLEAIQDEVNCSNNMDNPTDSVVADEYQHRVFDMLTFFFFVTRGVEREGGNSEMLGFNVEF